MVLGLGDDRTPPPQFLLSYTSDENVLKCGDGRRTEGRPRDESCVVERVSSVFLLQVGHFEGPHMGRKPRDLKDGYCDDYL